MEVSTIKLRQQWVLANPAQCVEDCGNPGYRIDEMMGGQQVATILLIPVFKSPLCWDAQIGLIAPDGQTIPRHRWTRTDSAYAVVLAQELLQNVGQPPFMIAEDALSIIVSRSLTIDEAAYVRNYHAGNPLLPALIGEIGQYDFANPKTRVGERSYQPAIKTKVYRQRG